MKRWLDDDLDYPIAMRVRISNRTLPIVPAPREEPANDKLPPSWIWDDEPSPRATAPTAVLRRVAEGILLLCFYIPASVAYGLALAWLMP